jgi:hypothetical protein
MWEVVGGVGFTRKFTQEEIDRIYREREEMRARLLEVDIKDLPKFAKAIDK